LSGRPLLMHSKKRHQTKRPYFYRVPKPGRWSRSDLADPRGMTALHVGAAVLEIEQLAIERLVGRVRMPVFGALATEMELDTVEASLRDLLLFVLSEDIEIVFDNRPYQEVIPSATESRPAQLCLFSGGIDSFVGLQLAAERASTEAVFCAHRDQGRVIGIVDELVAKRLRHIPVRTVKVPAMGSRGYIQLRGFLYVLAAGAQLAESGGKTLIVTECGPTMFQPRFSPADAITMTTHPEVMRLARRTLEVILGRSVEILIPFSDLTKAEVIALCPQGVSLAQTHSCISQRFGDHDGTCYGCVVRRLGALAAGRSDVSYRRDCLRDKGAHAGNLLTLLAFSLDVLTRLGSMPPFQTDLIFEFGKEDLFRRFALDNFAGVHRFGVVERHRLRPDVRRLYEQASAAVGANAFDARLAELASRAAQPDWTAAVPLWP